VAPVADIEKEQLVLATQNAEQPAEGQGAAVAGDAATVRIAKQDLRYLLGTLGRPA
jgi:hypothetical protein